MFDVRLPPTAVLFSDGRFWMVPHKCWCDFQLAERWVQRIAMVNIVQNKRPPARNSALRIRFCRSHGIHAFPSVRSLRFVRLVCGDPHPSAGSNQTACALSVQCTFKTCGVADGCHIDYASSPEECLCFDEEGFRGRGGLRSR